MSYFMTFYRNGILQASLFLVLLAWAISSTVYAIQQKPQTLLIALTSDGASLISEPDRASDVVRENFIYRFVSLAFNFTEKTYDENVGLAADLMSDKLFDAQAPELKKVSDALKGRTIVQSSVVTKITKLDPDRYEILLQTDQLIDQKNDSFTTRVRLKIGPAERTTRNAWKIEITEFAYDRP